MQGNSAGSGSIAAVMPPLCRSRTGVGPGSIPQYSSCSPNPLSSPSLPCSLAPPCRACAGASTSAPGWCGLSTAYPGCAAGARACACPRRCCATSPSNSRWRVSRGAGTHGVGCMFSPVYLQAWEHLAHVTASPHACSAAPSRRPTFPLPWCPAQDLRHMPALQDLVRAGMRWATSGDSSQWDAAMQVGVAGRRGLVGRAAHSCRQVAAPCAA